MCDIWFVVHVRCVVMNARVEREFHGQLPSFNVSGINCETLELCRESASFKAGGLATTAITNGFRRTRQTLTEPRVNDAGKLSTLRRWVSRL